MSNAHTKATATLEDRRIWVLALQTLYRDLVMLLLFVVSPNILLIVNRLPCAAAAIHTFALQSSSAVKCEH